MAEIRLIDALDSTVSEETKPALALIGSGDRG